MRIGIDVDGVLTDIEKFQIDYGTKYFYEKYNIGIHNIDSYYCGDLFNVSQELDNEFWRKNYKKYMTEDDPRVYASEVIQKLHDDGHEIYIVTARCNDCDSFGCTVSEMQKYTIDWLKKHNIYYDDIIWTYEEKVTLCKKNNIDVMIEDNPTNINDLSKELKVLAMNARYNKNCNGNNIYRVYSWYDAYVKLNDINKI